MEDQNGCPNILGVEIVNSTRMIICFLHEYVALLNVQNAKKRWLDWQKVKCPCDPVLTRVLPPCSLVGKFDMPADWNKLSLADPAAVFFCGGNLGRGPNLEYPQNWKLHGFNPLFFGWTQIHFQKKLKLKFFGSFCRGPKDIRPSLSGLWGPWPCFPPPPPGSASANFIVGLKVERR